MKNYFYGHYFKLQSKTQTIAFIPSYSKIGKNYFASLQVITDSRSFVIDFPYSEYRRGPRFEVKIGNNSFTKEGISLDYDNGDISLKGEVVFSELSPLKRNIMGPFGFIPFLECVHQVVSVKHAIKGKIFLSGEEFDFENDSFGYIEGDRGRSFPKVYSWTQSLLDRGSVMLSVADIPFGLFHFKGIIGFLCYDGKTKIIATYNGAKVKKIDDGEIVVKQGKYKLIVTVLKKNEFSLNAPIKGKMERIIKESVTCSIKYALTKNGETEFEQTSDNASFEYEFPENYEYIKH